jgi:type II secretory ATPase GspE/PulE/Tfp pilus assembly ATPase PilB-like protein
MRGDTLDIFNPVFTGNQLIEDALQKGASDIHFHHDAEHGHLSFRIDGDLIPIESWVKADFILLVNRIKVLFQLGTGQQTQPQDGRLVWGEGDLKRDFRISLIPTLHGESLVIRILSTRHQIPSLQQLGMPDELIASSESTLQSKEGLILATGPTGSGKTTTLYSLLLRLQMLRPHVHIVSIEDPIEIELPGLTQTQVHESLGLTFPALLRSILRHDPDVILIGEIRDEETAAIAVRAAMTGHLVLASLHSLDNKHAISRFVELGVAPILFAEALQLVINQRLHKHLDRSGRYGEFTWLIPDAEQRQEIKEIHAN